MSSDDGERARDEARVRASRARADLRMQSRKSERTAAIGAMSFYRRLVIHDGV